MSCRTTRLVVIKTLLMLNGSNLIADAGRSRPESQGQLTSRFTVINRGTDIIHKNLNCTCEARGVAGSRPSLPSGLNCETQRTNLTGLSRRRIQFNLSPRVEDAGNRWRSSFLCGATCRRFYQRIVHRKKAKKGNLLFGHGRITFPHKPLSLSVRHRP